MAVTILQQPAQASIQSSDDPLQYVFSSNQTGQANFSFYVQTFYNTALVSEDMVFPERAGGIGQIDIRQIIQPLVAAQRRVPPTIYGGENLREVYILVWERYGNPPALQSLQPSAIFKVMKAATDEETFKVDWLTLNYQPSLKWLTNAPNNTMYVQRGNPVFASILNSDALCLVEAYYFNSAGAVIGIGTSNIQNPFDKINIHLDEALMTSHVAPNNFNDIARIDIALNQSEGLRFLFLEAGCGDPVQLNWLNNIGGVDQFLFTHNRQRRFKTEIREFKKQFGVWNDNPTPGNYYVHDPLQSGPTHYLKVTEPTGAIHSGWVTEEYQHWFSEIIQSVDVIAVEGSNSERIPVTDTKSTLDENRFMDTLNFTVNYKKSNFKSINT